VGHRGSPDGELLARTATSGLHTCADLECPAGILSSVRHRVVGAVEPYAPLVATWFPTIADGIMERGLDERDWAEIWRWIGAGSLAHGVHFLLRKRCWRCCGSWVFPHPGADLPSCESLVRVPRGGPLARSSRCGPLVGVLSRGDLTRGLSRGSSRGVPLAGVLS